MIQSGKNNTKFKVCNVIRQRLLDDQEVHKLVQNKIYPLTIPKNTNGEEIAGNCIIYSRDQYSLTSTKMGIYEQSCRVIISCISRSYDESLNIAEAVFKSLQGLYHIEDKKTGVIINGINLLDSTEDSYEELYVQTLLFEIN